MDRRFYFLPQSCGDRLLSRATSCKLDLHRWPHDDPADDDPTPAAVTESRVELSFELRGELPLTGRDAAELLVALVREFRRPRQPRQEGGAA